MQHSLSTSGLSISQAQSISNLCNQRCKAIEANFSLVNNYSKTLTVNGTVYVETVAEPCARHHVPRQPPIIDFVGTRECDGAFKVRIENAAAVDTSWVSHAANQAAHETC